MLPSLPIGPQFLHLQNGLHPSNLMGSWAGPSKMPSVALHLHSVTVHLLSTYWEPGTAVGSVDRVVDKLVQSVSSQGLPRLSSG